MKPRFLALAAGACVCAMAGLLLAGSAWLAPSLPATAVTVHLACAASDNDFRMCREVGDAWSEQTGHRVELVRLPTSASERLTMVQMMLAAGSSDVDVIHIDVIWPGVIGDFFLDLLPYVPPADLDQHFAPMVDAFRVGDRLVALPSFADVGLLYYRKDLLEKHGRPVPETWAELAETARHILAAEHEAGNRRLAGYVFTAKAYEGLTCVGVELIASQGGRPIIAPDGTPQFTQPEAIEAIDTAAEWIRTGVSPRSVLTYTEEETRGAFQSGNALFMRNWPYAASRADAPESAVAGKVGIAPLPRGGPAGRRAGALGGGGMAVSRFSRHPELAADLVRHATSREAQKRRAIERGFNPTMPDLYADPAVLARQPLMGEFLPAIRSAIPRPASATGGDYNIVSTLFWTALHDTLSGRGSAAVNLARSERRLEGLRRLRLAGRDEHR